MLKIIRYNSSRLFNLLTIIVLSCLCLLLNQLTQIDFNYINLAKNRPEFSATGVNIELFDPKGLQLYKVRAENGIQYPSSTKILLKKLQITEYNKSTGILNRTLFADDGWIDSKTEQGFLGENTKLVITDPDPNRNSTIYTKNIAIDWQRRYLSSNAPVRVVQGKNVLTGVGFSFDYEKQFITINSKVKIIYVK